MSTKTIISILIIIAAGIALLTVKNKLDEGRADNANLRQTIQYLNTSKHKDSSAYIQLQLDNNELKSYLDVKTGQNAALAEKIDQLGIKIRRINSIVQQQYKLLDTTRNTIVIDSSLLKSIKNNRDTDLIPLPVTMPFIDSTKCIRNEGHILFDGKDLNLIFTKREVVDTTFVIDHWDRKQWKFWFIRSKLFGRRYVDVEIINSCGQTKTKVLTRKKNK